MRILVVEQQADAPAGLVGEWASERGARVDVVRAPELDEWPDPRAADAIVTLGSDRSVHASADPWIAAQLAFLRAAHDAEVPILGICFGGQALSLALGGDVHPTPSLEGSWDDGIELLDEQIPAGPWLNLHFESFSLPPGAELLARTPAGPSAFRHGPHLGTQFHPEVTPEIVAAWSERYRPAHPEVDYERLARDGEANRAAAPARAFELFDRWWERLPEARRI